ncbi:zinc-binding dehydrogenase [Candidatus Bipolaricaulota bacterium]|nr:zinc-binding dehydrogenase [Candidatus Bipolaricaulota bacterium]
MKESKSRPRLSCSLRDTANSRKTDRYGGNHEGDRLHEYGSFDVLQLKEIPKPIPKDNEVLVKTFATTVTTAGLANVSGKPFIARTYPLEQTAEAHKYVETGQKEGNIIITVRGSG